MSDRFYMPVYLHNGNKFFIVGNQCYSSAEEAMGYAVGDGFEMMCNEGVSCLPKETFGIPTCEEDAMWLLDCELHGRTVAVYSGPLYDEEITDEG